VTDIGCQVNHLWDDECKFFYGMRRLLAALVDRGLGLSRGVTGVRGTIELVAPVRR